MRFPAKTNAGCPKAPRDFPPRKDSILYPLYSLYLGLPYTSPSCRVCADGRTDGRTCGRTDGHVTITSQPKFLGSIGCQICLAMELRWRALPAGSLQATSVYLLAYLLTYLLTYLYILTSGKHYNCNATLKVIPFNCITHPFCASFIA